MGDIASGEWPRPATRPTFIGLDAFAEVGVGVVLGGAEALVPGLGLTGTSLRASVIAGPDVTGWSLGARFEL
jgi:hypothetical protein